jgi:hypothetical protein
MVPVGLALVLIVVACYWPAVRLGFVNFDDPLYVTENRHVQAGLTWEGLLWAFQDVGSSNWHPLTWLSHMLDWTLFGAEAWGHHLTNLILHGLNTLLLFTALSALTGAPGRSACVAALFAVHPMNVESVAWVAERKNLLSTALGLLALQGWAFYVRRPGWKRLLPVAACHGLGLMVKPMLVTMPFLLLLMDYWPCRRMAFKGSPVPFSRLVLEKVPLMALSAASVVMTLLAAAEGGALKTLDHFPLGLRVANALNAYLLYVGKLLWPFDLAVFYPYAAPRPLQTVLAAVLIGAMTLLALRKARQAPWLAVGWLWYLGTLVPVIGLVQVGRQSMADRYVYVPFIGLFIIGVWLLARGIGGAGRSGVWRSRRSASRSFSGACSRRGSSGTGSRAGRSSNRPWRSTRSTTSPTTTLPTPSSWRGTGRAPSPNTGRPSGSTRATPTPMTTWGPSWPARARPGRPSSNTARPWPWTATTPARRLTWPRRWKPSAGNRDRGRRRRAAGRKKDLIERTVKDMGQRCSGTRKSSS